MLRKDIEVMMKSKKQTSITIVPNKNERAMQCYLTGGYLTDCWGHRMDRKVDYWGYIEWDGKGNADKVDFNGTERTPFMRGGFLCAN